MKMRGAVTVSSKAVTVVAWVAAVAAAVLTLPTWVSLVGVGIPLGWNGLGMVRGGPPGELAAQLHGAVSGWPGWIVLTASVASAGVVSVSARRRRLAGVACALAVVALVAVVLVVAYPDLLLGEVRYLLGIASVESRSLLSTTVLISEAAATGVLFGCCVYQCRVIHRKAGNSRLGGRVGGDAARTNTDSCP